MPFQKARHIIQRTSHITRRRSIAKSISWRMVGSLDTFVLGYVVTGEPKVGAIIAGAEVITKMALYYVHERAWAHIKWGFRQ